MAETTPDQAVDLVQAAEETLDTAHRLESQLDMEDQPSTQNQPQLAAPATKAHQGKFFFVEIEINLPGCFEYENGS